MKARHYKILSLDGGGSWALIQIRTLMAIYGDVPGHEVLKDFDLVAANSGGSIVAGALFTNIRLSQAAQFFLDRKWRSQIFVEKRFPLAEIARAIHFGPRYVAPRKLDGLRQAFGSAGAGQTGLALGDISLDMLEKECGGAVPHLLIAGFDYNRCRATFFRSNNDSRSGGATQATLAQAIHASSNAPVNYFDRPAKVDGDSYWDGGISGLNNPVMAGVVEALANGVPATSIRALSIGTGSVVLPLAPGTEGSLIYQPRAKAGWIRRIFSDVQKLATAVLDDPPDASTFTAHVVLGGNLPATGETIEASPILRLSPLIQPLWDGTGFAMPPSDYIADFERLKNLDMDATRDDEVALIDRLTTRWLSGKEVPNQPVRADRHTLLPRIGYRWAQDAIAAWENPPIICREEPTAIPAQPLFEPA